MKKVPNKIILNLLLILLLNGCHTLQHNGFQDKIPKKEVKGKNIIYNKIILRLRLKIVKLERKQQKRLLRN